MLRSCLLPLRRCLGSRSVGGGGDGLLWHMDLKPHASGDYSIAVVQANSALEDQSQALTSPSTTLVGVYDGHGGPEASRFVSSRLFHHLHVEEVRKELNRGVWRIKGIIQVSRSIGDVYLKQPEFSRDPLFQQHISRAISLSLPVMTAEPSILMRKLRREDLFLIFASDGLWEHLSDEAVIEIVFRSPRLGIAKRLARAALDEAARKREVSYGEIKRMGKGARRNFHDDMTIVVVYLDEHKGGGASFSSRVGCTAATTFDCTNAPQDIFSLQHQHHHQQQK